MAFVVHYDAAGNADFVCSGSVVSVNVVITAGHCAVDENTAAQLDPSGFVVVTGAVNWNDTANRQLSNVSRVLVEPGYDPSTHTSDAALLVLSRTTTAPAIPLATSADQGLEQAGTGALIAGWGETSAGSDVQSLLQWAPTVVQGPGYCSQLNSLYDSSLELCVRNYPDDNTATCNGDSGGPLIAAEANGAAVEIGVTSTGPRDCNTNTGDYFTTVRLLSSWATSWIHAVAPPPSPPPLPTMSFADAASYVRQVLAGVLTTRFRQGHAYKPSCSRQAASRISCGFTFSSGPNDYYGTVTVYYVLGAGNQVEWTDQYVIHWVNDHCYFHSGHRNRCRIYTATGSW